MILLLHEVKPAETFITAEQAGEIMWDVFEEAQAHGLICTEANFIDEARALVYKLRTKDTPRKPFDYDAYIAQRAVAQTERASKRAKAASA